MKGKAKKVIAVDIDPIVLENDSADECLVMTDNLIPVEDVSVDMIISDFVLEHIDDPDSFRDEVDRILRPGGWFCARTPHAFHYITCAARLVPNKMHAAMMRYAQPDRNEIDVFPTRYRMNRLSTLRKLFGTYEDHSRVIRTKPSYSFGLKPVHWAFSAVHAIAPKPLVGALFIYLKKPETSGKPTGAPHASSVEPQS